MNTIKAVEIDVFELYPMEVIGSRKRRFQAKYTVLGGTYLVSINHEKNKKVNRKVWKDAYEVAKKWYNKSIKNNVIVKTGNIVKFDNVKKKTEKDSE